MRCNLANMKVPAAKVAMNKADIDVTTDEGEVLLTIAVAVSMILTDEKLLDDCGLELPLTMQKCPVCANKDG